MSTTVDVRKRLREPLIAFLRQSAKYWATTPQPVGVQGGGDHYWLGWTRFAQSSVEQWGAIPILDAAGDDGTFAEFLVSELLEFEANAVVNQNCPKGVKGTLRLAADLMSLAADVEVIAAS